MLFISEMYLMTRHTFLPFESLPSSESTKEAPKVTEPWQQGSYNFGKFCFSLTKDLDDQIYP